jgi:hypothetical protein
MKKLFVFVIVFCCGLCGFSQRVSKVLDISLVEQESQQWCWAASMQMVINHYRPMGRPISQDTLALVNGDFNYLAVSRTRSLPYFNYSDLPSLSVTKCCSPSGCIVLRTPPIMVDKQRYFLRSMLPFRTAYRGSSFEKLFLKLGYTSSQSNDSSNLTWDSFKVEIDECRPIIISDGLGYGNYLHAVVGFAYSFIPGAGVGGKDLKLLGIHNPSKDGLPCSGGESYVVDERYYKVIFRGGRYSYASSTRRIMSVVRGIIPISNRLDNQLCSLGNTDFFDSLVSKFLQPDTLDSKSIKVRHISKKLLRRFQILDRSHELENYRNGITSSVLYNNMATLKIKNDEIYLFEKFEGELFLSKVSRDSSFNFEPVVSINGEDIFLSNIGEGVRYDIIDYSAYNCRFFRFIYKDTWYLSPFENYKLGRKIFNQNVAYPELEVLKRLKCT